MTDFCEECYADLIEGYEHDCTPDKEVTKTVGKQ